MAIFALCIGVAVIQQFFKHGRASQRRIYWSCTLLASIAGLMAGYPDWQRAVGLSALAVIGLTVIAYAYTPYIKIGGKIRSLGLQTPDPEDVPAEPHADQQDPAPDAYSGALSAPKMWWLMVPLMLISAGNTYAFVTGEGEWWVAAIGIAFLIFLAVVGGYGDASWGYPIARGQKIQFAILAVVTLGTFTVLYLAAYAMAQRRPLRSKHSLDYRSHPHLRDKYPEL
ncbi:hypothetical protein L2K20_05250 [Mycobacterium sp. MBM]|nr:hypothetical protein [Mycobacterium sp. MBM]